MSWLTVIWSICAGLCFMLGLLHLLLWIKNRNNTSYLLSTIMAISAGAGAIIELALLQTTAIQTYSELLQLEVTFIYLLLISLVWLVSIQLDSYQRWLAGVIIAIWSVALIVNFVSPGSLVYEQVEEINRSRSFWGEFYSVGSGPANPWNLLANIGVVLIIIYVIINSMKAWQRGEQRRAVRLGGSIVVFMLLAGTHSMLVDNGIINTPYMVSFFYLAIILAMSYELVSQAIQAPLLALEVEANQKRWQDLLENVQLAVIAVNSKGMITYANPYLQNLTGYTEDELAQKHATMLLPDAEQKVLQDRLQQALESGPRPHSQWRIKCATGEERHLSWSSIRQFDTDGSVAGLVSIGSDITEQIKAQLDLQHTQLEMERMARVNIMGELASTMAHELNQPLAAILSNAQAARRMLASNKLEHNEFVEILDDIVRDDKRASEVIHGLRALLRRGEISRELFPVNDCLNEVLRLLKGELDANNIKLQLDIAAELPALYANRVEIQTVMINLIMNAIGIQSNNAEHDRFVHILIGLSDGMIKIEINDNGPGIKPDEIDKIFQPFFTTRRDGMGMGLALSRRIIEAHSGSIKVENQPTGGAKFIFSIPVTA